MLRLWTIQRLDVVTELYDTGKCLPSTHLSLFLDDDGTALFPEFEEAYSWMGRQVADKTGVDTGSALFWAWARITRRNLVDSTAVAAVNASKDGYQEVLLTLLVEKDRMVLSDFSAWHCPLNLWPCLTVEQEQALSATWGQPDEWRHPVEEAMAFRGVSAYSWRNANEAERNLVRQSWDLCLKNDLKDVRVADSSVQAALPFLLLEDVESTIILTT